MSGAGWAVWELREGTAEVPRSARLNPPADPTRTWGWPCVFAARVGEPDYGEVVVGGLFDDVRVLDRFDRLRYDAPPDLQWNPPKGKAAQTAPELWQDARIPRPFRYEADRAEMESWIRDTNAWEALILASMPVAKRKGADVWAGSNLAALAKRWDDRRRNSSGGPPSL